MNFLTRQNVLKAFAALIIIGFVVELFIVYTYAPSSNVETPQQTEQQLEEQFIGASLVPFSILSFTGSMFFQCNATTSIPEFTGIKGRVVQVGATPQGPLFLARIENASNNNAEFLQRFSVHLHSICGSVVFFREASVAFNASSVELTASSSAAASATALSSTSANSPQTVNLTKAQLSAYRDRFGRGAQALISDNLAVLGSVVEVRMMLSLVGRSIVPGSLLLEQPALPSTRTVNLKTSARVVSFDGAKIAIVQLPWENRTTTLHFENVLNEQLNARGEIILQGAIHSINLSFVNSIEINGNETVLQVGNFTDKAAALLALSEFGEVTFPYSTYVVEFNSTVVPEIPFEMSVFKQGSVAPLQAVVEGLALPEQFSVLLFQNVTLNQTISIDAQALVDNGIVTKIISRQEGLSLNG